MRPVLVKLLNCVDAALTTQMVRKAASVPARFMIVPLVSVISLSFVGRVYECSIARFQCVS